MPNKAVYNVFLNALCKINTYLLNKKRREQNCKVKSVVPHEYVT